MPQQLVNSRRRPIRAHNDPHARRCFEQGRFVGAGQEALEVGSAETTRKLEVTRHSWHVIRQRRPPEIILWGTGVLPGNDTPRLRYIYGKYLDRILLVISSRTQNEEARKETGVEETHTSNW